MNKKTRYIIACLFFVFALVQYNDADWYFWMPVYLSVTLLYLFQQVHKWIYVILLSILSIWAMTYVGDFVHWIKEGIPSITGSMKAESPEVELMREFFGLLLCVIAILFNWRQDLKSDNIIKS